MATYHLSAAYREQLINVCLVSLGSLSLWQGRSSLLALAAVHMVCPELDLGQCTSVDLAMELRWRIDELRQMGVRMELCS